MDGGLRINRSSQEFDQRCTGQDWRSASVCYHKAYSVYVQKRRWALPPALTWIRRTMTVQSRAMI